MTVALASVDRVGRRARRAGWAVAAVAPLALSDYWAFVVGVAATFAVVALGLRLLVGDAGQISLGHGALMAVGAFAAANLSMRTGVSSWWGFPVAALAGAAAGVVVGLPAVRLRGLHLAVTTLAFAIAADKYVFRLDAVSGSGGGLPMPAPSVGGWVLDARQSCVVAVAMLGLVWAGTARLREGRFGLALRLVRAGDEVAANVGVGPATAKLAAFMLSGAVAAVGGMLLGVFLGQVSSWTFSGQPTGVLSIRLVMLTLIGGSSSPAGVAIVAFSLSALPEVSRGAEEWITAVTGVLLLVVLIHAPDGVGGAVRRLGARWLPAGAAP